MTEWGRGAKAGLVAGGTWGILTAAETVVSLRPTEVLGPTIFILAILRLTWVSYWDSSLQHSPTGSCQSEPIVLKESSTV